MTVIRDDNNIPKIIEQLEALKSKRVEVGIFSSEQDSELMMVANVNEYGVEIEVTDAMRGYLGSQGLHLRADTDVITIPERSFVRSTYDEQKDDMLDKAERLFKQVLKLEIDAHTFYEKLGRDIQSRIQRKMRDIRNPANHPFTAERKGSSNPLIDNGRLRQSITWRVVDV